MEKSAHHILLILGRRTPPHLPWYLTWIITLQHQGRTCQSHPQPTAHWQHLLFHTFDAFGGACERREYQCSSTSSVNPLRQSKAKTSKYACSATLVRFVGVDWKKSGLNRKKTKSLVFAPLNHSLKNFQLFYHHCKGKVFTDIFM